MVATPVLTWRHAVTLRCSTMLGRCSIVGHSIRPRCNDRRELFCCAAGRPLERCLKENNRAFVCAG